MKVLIYSSYAGTPHIETELEIAKNLMSEGHDVYFLQCRRNLGSCFANPWHNFITCKLCITKIKNGYKAIDVPAENILSFPAVEVNISDIYHPDEIKHINDVKQITYKYCDVGMAVASSVVSLAKDHQPDISKYKNYIKTGIATSVYVYEAATKLLEDLKPDAVYLFNGRFLEVKPFMRVCEAKNIKFFTHERGGVLSRYLLRERSIPHSIKSAEEEINKLWGEGGAEKEAIGKRFYEERRNRVVQGWYSFTKDQVAKKLPDDFNNDKINIAIFNSSLDEYEGIPGFATTIYKDDNDGIEKLIADFEQNATTHFFLRVHPNLKKRKNTQVNQIAAIEKKYNNLTVIHAEEEVDTYELINKADKIIVFGSTTGIEAVYWNKPVIQLGKSFYQSLNCTYMPSTHEELKRMVADENLQPLNQYMALKYGYWCLKVGVPFIYYKPEAVRKGKFNGKRINPHFIWRALYIIKNKLTNAQA